MDLKHTKVIGPGHGSLPFRGLDNLADLPCKPGPLITADSPYGASPGEALICTRGDGGVQPGRFGRIFCRSNYRPSDEAIHELAETMREPSLAPNDHPDVPLGFTFLGQFIDHDLTLDATTMFGKMEDPKGITDFRTPNLDLDCLYGAGPGVDRFMYDVTPPGDKNPYKLLLDFGRSFDLPRNSRNTAIIGDLRNDENFLISQLHLAFIKFHNAAVDYFLATQPEKYRGLHGNVFLFKDAWHNVLWHYQWIIVHEFLPKVVGQEMVDDVLTNGFKVFDWERMGAKFPFMPVEFSTACYRLGHTMLRQDYIVNDLIKKDLFQLPVFGTPRINSELEKLDFTKFFDFPVRPPAQRSRLFDAKIPEPVFNLPFIDPVQDKPVSLPERNMLRALIFGVPSGQEVARAMQKCGVDVRVYSNDELGIDPVLSKHLGGEAPLFFYMLKESEFEPTNSRHLGPVGGRIVAEVFLNYLSTISGNYLKDCKEWKPIFPRANEDDFTMVDLLTFANA